jgi:hypothetical protein
MQNLINKQHGIGFLGWSSILGVLAFFVLTALRIFPLYTEKFAVITAMESAAKLPNAAKLSKTDIRRSFQKNIEINSNTTRFSGDKDLKKLVNVVTDKKSKKRYLHITYEGRNEYIKDIKFLIEFDRKVELGGSRGE